MSDHGAVLIAGCGDVGARLGTLLLARGEKVYGLRRRATQLPSGMLSVQADLTDPASLAALPHDIDRVVFLPAPGSRDEAAYRGLFLDGLRHLLDALSTRRAITRLIFVSSSAVYGEHAGAWVDEDTPCAPLAFNGRLLLQAENWLHQNLAQAVIARCSGIYGPGRTRLIDQVANATARMPGGIVEFTNRIHVEDVASALAHLLALELVHTHYVLSDDHPAGLGEIYAFIAAQLQLPLPPAGPPATDRAVGNKRLRNQRLRDSGLDLRYPDFRQGYAPLLRSR